MRISMTKQSQRCQSPLRVCPGGYHAKQCRRLLTDQGAQERHIFHCRWLPRYHFVLAQLLSPLSVPHDMLTERAHTDSHWFYVSWGAQLLLFPGSLRWSWDLRRGGNFLVRRDLVTACRSKGCLSDSFHGWNTVAMVQKIKVWGFVQTLTRIRSACNWNVLHSWLHLGCFCKYLKTNSGQLTKIRSVSYWYADTFMTAAGMLL